MNFAPVTFCTTVNVCQSATVAAAATVAVSTCLLPQPAEGSSTLNGPVSASRRNFSRKTYYDDLWEKLAPHRHVFERTARASWKLKEMCDNKGLDQIDSF